MTDLKTALESEQELARALIEVEELNANRGGFWRLHGSFHEAVGRIAQCVEESAIYAAPGKPVHLAWPTGGGAQLQPSMIAEAALKISARSGIDAAVRWVDSLATAPAAIGRSYIAIHGLEIGEVSQIGTIRLIPRKAAERTAAFVRWETRHRVSSEIYSLDALAIKDQTDFAWADNFIDPQIDNLWREEVQTALRAVAYVDGGSPTLGESWGEIVHPGLEPLPLGSGYSWLDENAPKPWTSVTLTEAGAKAAVRHLALEGDIRRRLDLAAERLVLSRRRTGAADRSIDLGIALEAMLGNNKFDITYKLGVRAALIVGENIEDRLITQKLVDQIYDLRSKAVHGGTPDGVGDVIERAQMLVAALLRTLAELGRVPDWKRLELTGGQER